MAFWQWMGLAVAAAVLCLLVRQQQPQLGGLCAAAAGAMLLLAALEQLRTCGRFLRASQRWRAWKRGI